MILLSLHMILTLAHASQSAWGVTLPVNGLTHGNRADFEQRVLEHFAAIHEHNGEYEHLVVHTEGDLATLVHNGTALRLSDLQDAMKGSQFSLHPETWYVYGRVALEWESDRELSERQIQRLEGALSGFGSVLKSDGRKMGDGTRFAEVVRDDTRTGFVYHAHIRFKKRGQGPASKLEVIVRACGIDMKSPTLIWENAPHMPWSDSDCGAKLKGVRRPSSPAGGLRCSRRAGRRVHSVTPPSRSTGTPSPQAPPGATQRPSSGASASRFTCSGGPRFRRDRQPSERRSLLLRLPLTPTRDSCPGGESPPVAHRA